MTTLSLFLSLFLLLSLSPSRSLAYHFENSTAMQTKQVEFTEFCGRCGDSCWVGGEANLGYGPFTYPLAYLEYEIADVITPFDTEQFPLTLKMVSTCTAWNITNIGTSCFPYHNGTMRFNNASELLSYKYTTKFTPEECPILNTEFGQYLSCSVNMCVESVSYTQPGETDTEAYPELEFTGTLYTSAQETQVNTGTYTLPGPGYINEYNNDVMYFTLDKKDDDNQGKFTLEVDDGSVHETYSSITVNGQKHNLNKENKDTFVLKYKAKDVNYFRLVAIKAGFFFSEEDDSVSFELNNKFPYGLVIGLTVGGVIILAGCIAFFVRWRSQQNKGYDSVN